MKNKKIKKVYMTKKRKAQIFMRKAITLIMAIMIATAIIGNSGQRTIEAIGESNTTQITISRASEANKAKTDPSKTTVREVTAYNSLAEQTDNSPCIGAWGDNLCELSKEIGCIVASNAFKKGEKILIDKIGECVVLDRMASRFANRIDIFMDKDKDRAVKFGIQKLAVTELE